MFWISWILVPFSDLIGQTLVLFQPLKSQKFKKRKRFQKCDWYNYLTNFQFWPVYWILLLGNALSWQSVTRKWKQKLKIIDLFQLWLDSSKIAEIVVSFDIRVNDETVFQNFSCNVTVFLLLSWFVTLPQFCSVSTGKVNIYDEVWIVFLWKVLFISFPPSDPHAKKKVNKFLLTSGSWYFRVEKCCPQIWHTLFFKLLFSQKQRRPFFYRCLYQLPFTCGERCEKKLSFFSYPGIVKICRLQHFTFLSSFAITLQTFLIAFENISFINIFPDIVSIVVSNINCSFSKNAFLSGLNCFLRTSFCFTNFILIPVNVLVYLGVQTCFSRW